MVLKLPAVRAIGFAAVLTASGCAQLSGLDEWVIDNEDASLSSDAGDAAGEATVDAAGEDGGAGDADGSITDGGKEGDTSVEPDVGGIDAPADSEASTAVCEAGAAECDGLVPRTCDANGQWQAGNACTYVCSGGACTGVCHPGLTKCEGNLLQTCTSSGQWNAGTACSGATPLCKAGQCVSDFGPSCSSLASTCGKNGDQPCCAATVVPAGTFKRSYDVLNNNDASFPATLSAFKLDRYEVTVGRFRKFVAAYPGSKPVAGSGKNPHNSADSGWSSSWNAELPADQAALEARLLCSPGYQTWTGAPASHEALPVNCVDWYMAYAFCIWDGGRLPTEAEWNYAAAGGGDATGQRVFPWSSPPNTWVIDPSYAAYDCLADGSSACVFADIPVVGSRSTKGDGRWGHADLAGSLWEWTQDLFGTYPMPCSDCAQLSSGSARVIRGGSFDAEAAQGALLNVQRNYNAPGDRAYNYGVRCVRSP